MRVLGIESSCDETGLAVYHGDAGTFDQVLHSQSRLHDCYGGVVPELASRDHARRLLPLLRQLLDKAGLHKGDVDAVAYTAGPGLAGALLVGACFAQSFAYARNIPAIAIHHMEGHLLVSLLSVPEPSFPLLALLVSGGHTMLVRADGIGSYEVLGQSCDDAAGEAFDKTAKLLGLAYPGGAALAELAEQGDAEAIELPRPMTTPDAPLDFSFSGLKTAVANAVARRRRSDGALADAERADIAASFQAAVVDTLVHKCRQALQRTGLERLVLAGGVAANTRLRATLKTELAETGAELFYPPASLCTDNGLMIAYAGWRRLSRRAGRARASRPVLLPTEVYPRWPMESLGA